MIQNLGRDEFDWLQIIKGEIYKMSRENLSLSTMCNLNDHANIKYYLNTSLYDDSNS